jgi:hypothetical protein
MKAATLLGALLIFLPLKVNGVTPVHCRVSIDSSIYDFSHYYYISFVPGPFTDWKSTPFSYGPNDLNSSPMVVQAFRKKNSNQFDLYTFSGKIGTSVVPIINGYDIYVSSIIFSRDLVDDDASWESIINYRKESVSDLSIKTFKVFDDDGTELLADTLNAYYGFDGNSTYIIACNGERQNFSYDSWRFRTNIASSSSSLAKAQAVSTGLMRIYGQDDGNYRVTLSPSSGNQVNFQMFDLLGRCVFSKQINNITSPQSFTIPESNIPNSPFIAKVSDKNGSLYKKQIPVR